MKPIEQKQKLVELRAQGYSLQKIAAELGIAKQTVINWAKELEVEIHNHRALALDALYEQHLMTKEARMEVLSEHLTKVKSELAKRQLDDVSTEKLFDMQLKLLSAMKQEKEALSVLYQSTGFDFPVFPSSKEYHSIDN